MPGESGFAALAERNPDFVGWITVPGTAVDYPVMQSSADAPEYYLRRNFDGEDDVNGTPFLDVRCSADPQCGNLVVYGHNMYSGVMFHDLLSYREEDFWREHPTVRFDTLAGEGTYQVFAVFPYDASSGEDAFHPHRLVDFESEEQFADYLAEVRAAEYYDTGVEPVYGDHILTLATCDRSSLTNGRLIVVARKTAG